MIVGSPPTALPPSRPWAPYLSAARLPPAWSGRSARAPRQTPYRDEAAAPSSSPCRLSRDQPLVGQRAFRLGEQVVHAVALRHLATVEPIGHFANVAVKVLGRNPMVNADDLALQERPDAFDTVRVDMAVADVFAAAVVDVEGGIGAAQAGISGVLVRVDRVAVAHVGADDRLNGLAVNVGDGSGAQLAVALQHTHDDCLASAALRAGGALVGVLVLRLAAHESLINLNAAFQRRVERLRAGSVAEAVKDEPGRLLGHAKVGGERRGSDALGVRRDHPDSRVPRTERQLRILEDGPDADAEALAADVALVCVRA